MSDRARLPAGLRGAGPADLDPEDDLPGAEAGIVVRDLRTNERFWVHDTIIDDYGPLLGADTFTIYSSLSCMANKGQYCWPSLARLARHWGKGKGTVVRAIALLTDLQLIYVRRTEREDGGNSNNIYYLLEPLPIDEGLAGLVAALQRRGASREQAIAQVVGMLPQGWEPLRRKKAPLRSRNDWATMLERLVPVSAPEPSRDSAETGGSITVLPRSLPEPGGSDAEPGGAGRDRGGRSGDWDGHLRHQPGVVTQPGDSHGEPGRGRLGTGLDLAEDSKDQANKGTLMNQSQPTEPQQQAGVVLRTEREIIDYALAEDEVLIEHDDNQSAVPIALRTLVCRDILATERNWGLRVNTECYYSAEQFLGVGDETWTEEEERKRAYHSALRRDLESVHRELGAFTIEEALAAYFTADLVARFRSEDPDELQRLRGWLGYVRGEAGKGLENPAGFLRSRIESKQWPPRGAARRREGPR